MGRGSREKGGGDVRRGTPYVIVYVHVYQVWCFYQKMHDGFAMPPHYD